MIYTITIIIVTLVALNFFLLIFSTNKVKEQKQVSKLKKLDTINKPILENKVRKTVTTKQVAGRLSPTGS